MPQILDQYGRPIARAGSTRWRNVLARYDAAQTTEDNMRHWGNADGLSADAAHSPEVRRKLRNRARYEIANNSYCKGMVETIAADTIGSGPRIQILTGNRRADDWLEREFMAWAAAIKLPKKLRLMRKAKCGDGEALALKITNRRLPTQVQLDLRVLECDRLSTPWLSPLEVNAVDGVDFDRDGVPTWYHILREHPGNDGGTLGGMVTADRYAADQVYHLFRQDRPEQHRGVPEVTPALPLFGQLRRYTLAVLAAAETAATFAAVIESNQPAGAGGGMPGTYGAQPDESGGAAPAPMDTFELAMRMVTVLPEGYKLGQVDAKQPTTTYGEFKREILCEAFSAIVMPFAVGGHDSSDFNFASGKLDRLTYSRIIRIDQTEWESELLNPLFYAWYDEAALRPGYLPAGLPPAAAWTIAWYWDGQTDIDPEKAARATKLELESGQTSLPAVFARRGEDHEAEMRKQAEALGMTLEAYRRRLADKLLGPVKEAGNSGEEGGEEDGAGREEGETTSARRGGRRRNAARV